MARPSIVLIFLVVCFTVALRPAVTAGEQDAPRSVSEGWQKFKNAIGGLTGSVLISERRQAYQDPQQRHYPRPHAIAPGKRARPGYRGPGSHPPRPAMFGGFQPANGIPMRPRPLPMPAKPSAVTAPNQHLNQQHKMPQLPPQQPQHAQKFQQPQQQHYVQQQQQQQQQQHMQHMPPNQQASPKIRTVAVRPEQPQPEPSQQQQQQEHFPYPIELLDLPPPPVPPHTLAQEELLKLQFASDEYLMYLYSHTPVIKEPEQDIQADQSVSNQVTHQQQKQVEHLQQMQLQHEQQQQEQQLEQQQRDEQHLQAPVSPSTPVYDPYRYKSVQHWENKDRDTADGDWTPIPSPWGDDATKTNSRDAYH